MSEPDRSSALHDLYVIAASLPESAETMLIDTRLTDETHASSRVFRVYHPVPAHYHETCDEYLLVLSGRGLFFLGDEPPFEVRPGQLIFFRQRIVHGMTEILESPFVFFTVDTPRRDPRDVIFVDPDQASVDTLIKTQSA